MKHANWSCWLPLVLTAACSYPTQWEREELILPGSLPPERQVKIWSADTVFWWHAVIYTQDSITGIPYTIPTTCASCRRALPRHAVDSIRVAPPPSTREDRESEALALLLAGTLAVLLEIHHIGK